MIGLSRVGDLTIGTCTGHQTTRTNVPGIILNGSNRVFMNGIGISGMGSIALSNCGHTGYIVTGANNVFVNGIPAGTRGSYFVGTYTGYVIGCSNTIMCRK